VKNWCFFVLSHFPVFTTRVSHHQKETQTKPKKRVGFSISSEQMGKKMLKSDRIVPPQLFI